MLSRFVLVVDTDDSVGRSRTCYRVRGFWAKLLIDPGPHFRLPGYHRRRRVRSSTSHDRNGGAHHLSYAGILTDLSLSRQTDEASRKAYQEDANTRLDPESIAKVSVRFPLLNETEACTDCGDVAAELPLSGEPGQIRVDVGARS